MARSLKNGGRGSGTRPGSRAAVSASDDERAPDEMGSGARRTAPGPRGLQRRFTQRKGRAMVAFESNTLRSWTRAARVAAIGSLAIAVGLAGIACGGSDGSTGGDNSNGNSNDNTTAAFWDVDCGGCHETETSATAASDPAVEGLLGQFHDANGSFTAAGGTCKPCHGLAEATLETLHDPPTGTPPSRLWKTEVSETACLGCHGSYDALAARTASSTVLTDSGRGMTEGGVPKVVNPHEAPTLTPAHVAAGMNCGSCHGSHRTKSAAEYCTSCHHANVYECHTCHA